jgi:hypothetical protein
VFSLAAFGGLYMCFAVLVGWWPARRLSSAAAASTLIAGERREGAFELTGPGGVPGLLPRDRDSFTGRQHELQELAGAVAGSGGVVGIYAIGGMAGVGKTAFAVHTAHRLAGRFPDGQIFLALHGHTPGREPVDPGDALASLLLMVGVAAAQIPPGVEIRAA